MRVEEGLASVTQLSGPPEKAAAFRKGELFPQLINVDGVGGRGSQDEKRQRWEGSDSIGTQCFRWDQLAQHGSFSASKVEDQPSTPWGCLLQPLPILSH